MCSESGLTSFYVYKLELLTSLVNLVLIVSTWKYSTLPLLEVFNLLKLLPHLHLEAFLEGDRCCRSSTEILSKQWGWAEGCLGTQAIASNCKCHNLLFCPEQYGLGQVPQSQIHLLLRLMYMDFHMTVESCCGFSSED